MSFTVAEVDFESIPAIQLSAVFQGRYLSLQKFHSCFHMVVHSFWWNFKFSNDRERPLTTIWKLGFTFQAENLHLPWLGSSSFPDWNARIVLSLICTDTLIHNCPAKRMVHQWIPHWIFWSVWKFPGEPDQKIHISFQFSSPFSICVWNVWKAYPRPVFSIENVLKLYAPLQFIIFVRNVSS